LHGAEYRKGKASKKIELFFQSKAEDIAARNLILVGCPPKEPPETTKKEAVFKLGGEDTQRWFSLRGTELSGLEG